MLDCYGCDKEKLGDTAFITKLLDELPDVIKMHKIAPPQIVYYKGSGNPEHFDRGGISGVVIIAESHISIHTFVKQEFASIDVFSCKEFDYKMLTDYVKKEFGAENVESKFLRRGKLFVR